MRGTRRHVVGVILTGGIVVGFVLSPQIAIEVIRLVLYSPWFPVVLVGLYVVRPLFAWPITAVSVIVGYRYGLALGVPVALVGAVGTSLIPYTAAQYFQSQDGWIGVVAAGSERYFTATGELRGLIAARLAPTPAEPISAAAGIANVPVLVFVLGTAVGELPWTVVAVIAGHSMRRLSLVAAAPAPWIVAAGLLAAIVIIAGPAYRYMRESEWGFG